MLVPFLIASVLVAVLVTISMLWFVQSVGTRDLPEMTAAGLARADFSLTAFREYSYEGEFEWSGGHDTVLLVPAGHGLRLQIRLAPSGKPSSLFGSLATGTGAFGAGPHYDSESHSGTYRVDGRIRGPALVDRIPTVHLEATVRTVFPRAASNEGPIIRRWSGLLRATGRTRL